MRHEWMPFFKSNGEISNDTGHWTAMMINGYPMKRRLTVQEIQLINKKMKPQDFDINKVAESLQGSTKTLNDAVSEVYEQMTEDDLSSDDYEALDNLVFECEECNWWCEKSEESIEINICDDCYQAREENKDNE